MDANSSTCFGEICGKTPQNGEKFVKKDTKRVKIGPIANGISEVECSQCGEM
jgi:hypothetical protein